MVGLNPFFLVKCFESRPFVVKVIGVIKPKSNGTQVETVGWSNELSFPYRSSDGRKTLRRLRTIEHETIQKTPMMCVTVYVSIEVFVGKYVARTIIKTTISRSRSTLITIGMFFKRRLHMEPGGRGASEGISSVLVHAFAY